ncbi:MULTISPECIES: GlxA family transcriptional regulator [unclassified Microbacterium]|uniref:GlxA family transcriptional regulator n=1 Tax=unclassified Microbacterium TaxID=2609290 RepID=UPI00346546D0
MPTRSVTDGATQAPARVGFLVYDGVTLLDVAGPAEVFAEANKQGADYELSFLSPTGADVVSNLGMRVSVDGAVDSSPALDTYIIPGSTVYPRARVSRALADAASVPATSARRVASVCTGAFVLAATGLLDGKRATTHWKVTQELAALCPSCDVQPDAIYVRDGSTYSSAGVTAGIDLALALVEEDHGPALTREVARALVVYMQRSGGQSQFSAPLQGVAPRSPMAVQIAELVASDPQGDFSLDALAAHLNISARHLTRLIHDELSSTPARYVRDIRFEVARGFLDQGHTATAAAQFSGFPSYESLRQEFGRRLGISPAAYRRGFGTTSRDSASP